MTPYSGTSRASSYVAGAFPDSTYHASNQMRPSSLSSAMSPESTGPTSGHTGAENGSRTEYHIAPMWSTTRGSYSTGMPGVSPTRMSPLRLRESKIGVHGVRRPVRVDRLGVCDFTTRGPARSGSVPRSGGADRSVHVRGHAVSGSTPATMMRTLPSPGCI